MEQCTCRFKVKNKFEVLTLSELGQFSYIVLRIYENSLEYWDGYYGIFRKLYKSSVNIKCPGCKKILLNVKNIHKLCALYKFSADKESIYVFLKQLFTVVV